MEPLTIVYISCMSVLGIIASTIYCQNSENINKKNINKKKRFKHYRTH
jgi:Ca2+/Na+ antiporter